MWFLTQEGIDRYDGSKIKHYAVFDGSMEVAPQINLNWYIPTAGTGCGLWVEKDAYSGTTPPETVLL